MPVSGSHNPNRADSGDSGRGRQGKHPTLRRNPARPHPRYRTGTRFDRRHPDRIAGFSASLCRRALIARGCSRFWRPPGFPVSPYTAVGMTGGRCRGGRIVAGSGWTVMPPDRYHHVRRPNGQGGRGTGNVFGTGKVFGEERVTLALEVSRQPAHGKILLLEYWRRMV